MAEKKKNKITPPKFNFYWIYAIAILGILGFAIAGNQGTGSKLTLQGFEEKANKGHVEKVTIIKNTGEARVYIYPDTLKQNPDYKEFNKKSYLGNRVAPGPQYIFEISTLDKITETIDKINEKLGPEKEMSYNFTTEEDYLGGILRFILPLVILIAIWMFIMRRVTGGGGSSSGPGQIFNIGKSKAKLFENGKNVNVSFKDVAGLEGAKEEIEEIVDFLKNPKKYTELGAKIPKGALLVGPPGTGKTLLAKAVAGEAKVPFFSMSGSDFVEMFVGVGASRVRDLFRQAKEKAPSIIFIDEIDAIGRARGKNPNFGSNDERENTLNQLLTEMDGFGTNSGVIILAATNRADVLDSALMRAGRFDRQIHVEMPNLSERKEIFKVHLKPIKVEKDLDIDFLAKQTPGFSGADIANLCNEAALTAARKKKKVIEKQDFLDAVDRIIGGLEKKSKVITDKEKKTIAYHEAGHAAVSWYTKYASPLVKVTIVPRGRSLGAAWYLPEERQLNTTEQLKDEMCATLGGRAAEEVQFGEISTGALSDLERVTKQAYAMVSIYGLNDELGNISYYNLQDGGFTKPYSEKTAELIDKEVSNLIEGQYQRAKQILRDNKDKLDSLAQLLYEKEIIFKDDLEKILGKRPYEEDQSELEKAEASDLSKEAHKEEDITTTAGDSLNESTNEQI